MLCSFFSRLLRLSFLALALSSILACAGGSSGTDPGTPIDVGGVEDQLLDLVNQSRAQHGMPPVAPNALVTTVAEAHSVYMSQGGGLTHEGPNGEHLAERLQEASIRYSSASENLAFVQGAGDAASYLHAELMASPRHRENILGSGFTTVGIGVADNGVQVWLTEIFIAP